MKKELEELIKYVNDWMNGHIVEATANYKFLDRDDRKIYALGWKHGMNNVLAKLEEINRKYKK